MFSRNDAGSGHPLNIVRKVKKRSPESIIAAGSVSTQASSRFLSVPICYPDELSIIVPSTPEDKTCVVLTGRPSPSAAPIVAIAVISAAAPCA